MPLDCTTPVNTNICTSAELNALAQLVADIRDVVCNSNLGDSCVWAVSEQNGVPIPNTTTDCQKVIAVSQDSYIEDNGNDLSGTSIISSYQTSIRDTDSAPIRHVSIIASYGSDTFDSATWMDGVRVSAMIASFNSTMKYGVTCAMIASTLCVITSPQLTPSNIDVSIISSSNCQILTSNNVSIIGSVYCNIEGTQSAVVASEYASVTSGAGYGFIAGVHALDAVGDANRLEISGENCFAIGSTVTDSFSAVGGNTVDINGLANGVIGCAMDAPVDFTGDYNTMISCFPSFSAGGTIEIGGDNQFIAASRIWATGTTIISSTRLTVLSCAINSPVSITIGQNNAIISATDPVGVGTFNNVTLAANDTNLSAARYSIVTGFQNSFTGDTTNQYNFVGGASNNATGKFINRTFIFGSSATITGGGSNINNSAFVGFSTININSTAKLDQIGVFASSNATIDTTFDTLNCAFIAAISCNISDLSGQFGQTVSCAIIGSTSSTVGGAGTVMISCGSTTSLIGEFNTFLSLNGFTPSSGRNERVYMGNPHFVNDPPADGDESNVLVRSSTPADDGEIKNMPLGTLFQKQKRYIQIQVTPDGEDVPVQNGLARFNIPADFAGKKIVALEAYVTTAGTTGNLECSIYNDTQSLIILSTVATIESGETSSLTAANQPVVDPSNNTVNAGDQISVDVFFVSTTPQQGLRIIVTIE